MIEFLDPKNRQEVLICCAGVALHGLLAGHDHNSTIAHGPTVSEAFAIAREFLRQAELVPP